MPDLKIGSRNLPKRGNSSFMVNLVTIAVACVSVWYEATPPNAASAGFFGGGGDFD